MTSLPYLWHLLHCISSKSSGNVQRMRRVQAFRCTFVVSCETTRTYVHICPRSFALSLLNITQIWPHPSLSSLNVQSVFLYALSVKMEIMAVFFINNAKRWLPLYRCLLFVRIVRGQDCPVSTAAPAPLNWERGPCIVVPAPSFILFLLT